MFNYLVIFQYTKNGNLYSKNRVIKLNHEFGVDDIEIQEEWARLEFEHKSWIVNVIPLAPSLKN